MTPCWECGGSKPPGFGRRLCDECAQSSERLKRRLVAKVQADENGCWIWQAQRDPDGYGRIQVGTRNALAHRISCVGPLTGDELDHMCRVRACVNPAHLRPLSKRENILIGVGPSAINARKTHCVRGHPFDEQNTYIRPCGSRVCRKCDSLRHRDRAAA
jgi:hypothetical protein